MPKRPYPAWQPRHGAVLVWLLQNPHRKQYECAAEMSYSPSQVSRIVNSPDFRRHYRAARKIIEEEIFRSYIRRLGGHQNDA